MPTLGHRIFKVEVIGFAPIDRTLIASMFALSQRRTYQYVEYDQTDADAIPRKRPDLFLTDVDTIKSIIILKSKNPSATHPAVLIGADSHGLKWELAKRPVKWASLFEALDKSVESASNACAEIPLEKRSGWPFYDRRRTSRPDLDSENEPLDQTSSQQSAELSNTAKLAPTASLVDPGKINLGDGPGNLPLISDPAADTVLVVDDNTTARRFLASQLASFGVNIDFAANGEQALGMTAFKRYVCVLLDATLPGIDGYQTCRLIKAEASQPPSVVMLSDKINPLDRVRARMAGCDAFLDKQVELGTLVITLARYASPRSYATVVTPLP